MPPGVRFERAEIHPHLSGQWALPAGAARSSAILWLHGGAFLVGSSNSYRAFAAHLAVAAGVAVFVPDYRLLPEHPFPAATIDTQHALEWLERQGIAPHAIGIGGDSAGANLAAGAVQARLEAGHAPPGACWLLSGWLDLTHSGGSIATRSAADPFISAAGMPVGAQAYLRDADPKDPRASPLFGPMHGFPPTLIQVGEDEVLFDDSWRMALALKQAGREVIFQEWAGMMHVFPFFLSHLDEAHAAIAQAGIVFRRRLLGE